MPILSPAAGSRLRRSLPAVLLLGLLLLLTAGATPPPAIPNPILFVTQVPVPADFTTIGSVFGNQLSDVQSAARGGDLYILYPNGTLRNLTREAGFGAGDGFQGAQAIAVRDPTVHWSGTKALFSMVVGAPTEQYRDVTTFWQIYEVSGLGASDKVVITRVAKQPAGFNNVAPLYSPDGRILFTSDRPRGGEAHLYPQLDEYEEAPTNTGIWSLDPATGDLRLLDHVPSGAFTPVLDSFGRVIYTRWDHLQRDQQADTDALDGDMYGTFDYADETAGAARLTNRVEVFPEPRAERTDLLAGTPLEGHSFNQFFPWQINPDGTELETINHVGRHDLHEYFNRDRHDDDDIVEFIASNSARLNPNSIENFLQIKEDPAAPGRYVGIDAPEFRTHASGGIVALTAPPGLPADQIPVAYVTDPSTREVTDEGGAPPPASTGHYRDPLPLSNGTLVAAHSAETRADANIGSPENPGSRYAFRLKLLTAQGGSLAAGAPLTAGIHKTVSFWDPDVKVSYSGELWELQPVEVRARQQPPVRTAALDTPERSIFTQEGVDPDAFRAWLRAKGLAVMVSRNVTTRDIVDRQQPFNLQVSHGGARTTGTAGPLYQVSHLQVFQGDQLRGLGGTTDPRDGRRVLARALHDPQAANPDSGGGPAGSVRLAADGSAAAFVPARRALTWQLTNEAGSGVVRERYWLTFQPGEIRTCTSCHGPSSRDQEGKPAPTNAPEALRSLLRFWKTQVTGCQASATAHCLSNGRFRVSVHWQDPQGHTGDGQTIPLTGDTGAFWFFNASNLELVVKVLDGRPVNGNWWVFYGALSNVHYTLTVTDTLTGTTKTWDNPAGRQASVGDAAAFPGTAATAAKTAEIPLRSSIPNTTAAGCAASPTALCLNQSRFRVAVTWKDFAGNTGSGQSIPLTADTGAFWFFNAANLEVVVKVLDGHPVNGKWWVFFGALSNVEYTLTVTDTTTGVKKTYTNPKGRFASVGDTGAFP
jgi:hypothetical protein